MQVYCAQGTKCTRKREWASHVHARDVRVHTWRSQPAGQVARGPGSSNARFYLTFTISSKKNGSFARRSLCKDWFKVKNSVERLPEESFTTVYNLLSSRIRNRLETWQLRPCSRRPGEQQYRISEVKEKRMEWCLDRVIADDSDMEDVMDGRMFRTTRVFDYHKEGEPSRMVSRPKHSPKSSYVGWYICQVWLFLTATRYTYFRSCLVTIHRKTILKTSASNKTMTPSIPAGGSKFKGKGHQLVHPLSSPPIETAPWWINYVHMQSPRIQKS